MPNHAKAIEAARNAYSGVTGELPWIDGLTAAITAFLRTVEASPAMIEAGPRAYAEHFSSHTGPAVFGESMAEAFKAMSETLANEVEQGNAS